MPLRFVVRPLFARCVGAVSATVLFGAVLAASNVIFVRPTTHRVAHDDDERHQQHRDSRVERAACGICGHVTAMAEADFCGDCGLLVHLECFGAYCDTCCQPCCTRCATRTDGVTCGRCRDQDVEAK